MERLAEYLPEDSLKKSPPSSEEYEDGPIFGALPEEVTLYLLTSHLSPEKVLRLSITCKKWRRLLLDPSIWKELIQKFFPKSIPEIPSREGCDSLHRTFFGLRLALYPQWNLSKSSDLQEGAEQALEEHHWTPLLHYIEKLEHNSRRGNHLLCKTSGGFFGQNATKLILEKTKADPSQPVTSAGITPLHIHSSQGHEENVQALLNASSDPCPKENLQGMTPADMAKNPKIKTIFQKATQLRGKVSLTEKVQAVLSKKRRNSLKKAKVAKMEG